MAWRGIHLSQKAHLSVEHRALKINFDAEDQTPFRQSLEDLAYLILDTPEITLSGTLLAALAESNILVLGVNSRHLPVWTSLPWTKFHRQGDILKSQIEATLPQKKQLWAHIVKTKITAQAHCLSQNALLGGDHLLNLLPHIRSGDPDNTEARAARSYWKHLFPDREFRRHDDDLPNALLNYGYALLRAGIARHLCAIGFIPQLGIHHDSVSNAYNLADDLIEPYRPIADHFALKALADEPSENPFTTDHRRAMAQLLEAKLSIDGEIFATLPAIEVTTTALKHTLASKESALLKFPTFTSNS